jgi:hypothetical protein
MLIGPESNEFWVKRFNPVVDVLADALYRRRPKTISRGLLKEVQ